MWRMQIDFMSRLDPNEPHGQSGLGFCGAFGIDDTVLVRFFVWFDKMSRTGFHAIEDWGRLRSELE